MRCVWVRGVKLRKADGYVVCEERACGGGGVDGGNGDNRRSDELNVEVSHEQHWDRRAAEHPKG